MATFLDFTNNISNYYNSTSKNAGIPFDLKNYDGKDLDEAISKNKGVPDLKLIAAKDFQLAQQRMADVNDATHKDYYDRHTKAMQSKISNLSKLTDNFVRARKS